MVPSSCPECTAIYRELLDLIELSRRTRHATLQQAIAWFEQHSKDDDFKNRIGPALASVRRRMIDHQEATGHTITPPLPPGRIINSN